jgi:Mce-associated membrane protein
VSRRTTGLLSVVSLLLAAVLAAEAWYLWGTSDPRPTAARPVVTGDVEARTAVETAAQDAAAIFTTSWRTYDRHLDRVSALMTPAMAARYRTSAAPVKARVVADRASTDTRVSGSGVVRASADEVLALVFLDQRTRTPHAPPAYTARRALVTLVRSDGGWLVDNVQTG